MSPGFWSDIWTLISLNPLPFAVMGAVFFVIGFAGVQMLRRQR